MNLRLSINSLLFAVALMTFGCASQPAGQADAGWITLVNGAMGLDNWTRVGDANWHAVDGAIQADR